MSGVEIVMILLGAEWLGFGIWVLLYPKPLRKNLPYDDAPGSMPLLWMIAGVQALFVVPFLLVILIIRAFSR